MLVGGDAGNRHRFADLHRRQLAVLVVVLGVLGVAAFFVDGEKARIDHGCAARAEHRVVARIEIDRHGVERRVLHLARDRALPDQLVKFALVVAEVLGHLARRVQRRSRADRFVGFLRVLLFAAVEVRRLGQALGAVVARDDLADFGDRIGREADRVGTHISDQADRAFTADRNTFVEALGDAHRARGREAEFARGFLLQGRGRERRRWTALAFLRLHFGDDEAALRGLDQRIARGMRVGLVGQVELLELLAAQPDQACSEALVRMRAVGFDRPVFLRLERFDLFLALDDHAQRRRLHAARGQAALHFAPEHRREIESDQVVERAARLLCVDQVVREPARIRHGLLDRARRDFGEHHAVHFLAVEQLLLLEDFRDVPGNGFAFAIQVGREIDGIGHLRRLGDRVDVFLVLVDQLVGHREVVVGIDRAFFRLEVANVTVGRQDLEVLAEIFVDRLRLGGRFDDEEIFCHGITLRARPHPLRCG